MPGARDDTLGRPPGLPRRARALSRRARLEALMLNVPPPSTAVAPYVAPSPLALTNGLRPQTLEQAIMLVTKLAGASILPPALREPQNLLLVILKADDLGLSVGQALDGL